MKKPIPQNTVLTLDKETGKILNSWGSNMFFLPHMVNKYTVGMQYPDHYLFGI